MVQRQQESPMAFTIEIDCPPMTPRPDTYLPAVLAGTGLELTDLEYCGSFFGNWTWQVKPEAEDRYKTAKPMLAERLTALYHRGACRYASW
jgi:hypothetical protein